MFDILSTIGLTAQRRDRHRLSGVRDGRDAARAVHGRRRSRRLVRARCDDRRERARSIPLAGSAFRLSASPSGLPVAALVSAFFAFGPISAASAGGAFAGAGRGECDPTAPRVAVCASLRRGPTARAVRAERRWGDIFTGVAALPLAWAVMRFGRRVAPLVFAWSAIGVADLVDAIALGALSAPGPFQIFVGPPTSAIMTTLPWLIVPGFLVPSLIFIHVVIVTRLLAKSQTSEPGRCGAARAASRSRPEMADAGAYAPASEVVLGTASRPYLNGGALPSQPARRRPSPQADSVTPWGTGRPRSGRRRRSECAS